MDIRRPALVLAFKLQDLKDFPTYNFGLLLQRAMAWASAGWAVLQYTEQDTLWERIYYALLAEGSASHCELMVTLPCTLGPNGEGVCHVPCVHRAGKRVTPNHCVVITCAYDGVYIKESPAQAEPQWIYYEINATDEEIYRLYTFSICMLGSKYRKEFTPGPGYFIEDVPGGAPPRIYAAYARTGESERYNLAYLHGAREYAEEIERGDLMRAQREEFDKTPHTELEKERFVTKCVFEQLALILGLAPGETVQARARKMLEKASVTAHEFLSTPHDEFISSDYVRMFGEQQPFRFTCVQFTCAALGFAGILERCRATTIWGLHERVLYPANCLVHNLYAALRAETPERIGRRPANNIYNLLVDKDSTMVKQRAFVRRERPPPPEEEQSPFLVGSQRVFDRVTQ